MACILKQVMNIFLYCSEVAEREQHTLEADVWSVGCVLYTLLVRKPPFQENSVTATLDRVKHAKFDLPPTLSENAKNLIQSLLQKNPQKRLPLNSKYLLCFYYNF